MTTMSGKVYLNNANPVKYFATATELPQRIGKGSVRIVYEKLTELEERLGLSGNHEPSGVVIVQDVIRCSHLKTFNPLRSSISQRHWKREISEIWKSSHKRLVRLSLQTGYCIWDRISNIAGRTISLGLGDQISQAGLCPRQSIRYYSVIVL